MLRFSLPSKCWTVVESMATVDVMGGTLGASLLYIKENGVVAESAYPYVGKEESCQVPASDLYTLKEWKQLQYTDEDTIKELVSSRPVSVGIASSWSNLQVDLFIQRRYYI